MFVFVWRLCFKYGLLLWLPEALGVAVLLPTSFFALTRWGWEYRSSSIVNSSDSLAVGSLPCFPYCSLGTWCLPFESASHRHVKSLLLGSPVFFVMFLLPLLTSYFLFQSVQFAPSCSQLLLPIGS